MGMGTMRFCLTESIASKAPAGSQAKLAGAVGVLVPRHKDRNSSLHWRLGDWRQHVVEIGNLIDTTITVP